MTEHSKDCREAQALYSAAVAGFEAQHPDYCRTCGGWGGSASPGCSVPFGSTWVSLPDETDPCPDCQEQGLCPFCSSEMDVENDSPCPQCGWEWGDPGIAEPPGCICPDLEEVFDEQ